MSSSSGSQDDIRLTISDQKGTKSYYKIKRNLPMSRLLVAFCKKKEKDYRTYEFLINGNRFNRKKTPLELNLEDNDEVEALEHQFGG